MKNVPASPNTYFHRVAKQTPTRLWVNNAMPHEAESALQAGAVGASTNPTYPSKLEPGYLNGLIDGLIGDPHSDDWVAEEVYRRAVTRLQSVFLPLYRETRGRLGHVAIQGDPRVNTEKHPPCYVTYIAGILEDYLKAENAKQGSPVSNEVIEQAGCAGHRVAYSIYRERRFAAVLIGGEDIRGKHIRKRWVPICPPRHPNNYENMLAHFLDCIINDKEPLTSGEDGDRAVEVMCAVLQSQ